MRTLIWLAVVVFILAPQISSACEFVQNTRGLSGAVPLKVEKFVTGLKTPWGIAFLPNGDGLVTERSGQLRLVRAGKLIPARVLKVDSVEIGESGLLGIAIHPDFASNNFFYLYYSKLQNGQPMNRIERYKLSADHASATLDKVILTGIRAGQNHNGGRIKFGPDGMLYVSTGETRNPPLAQDASSLNGKILRITPEGGVPSNNPVSGSPIYASGIRNSEGFDFVDETDLIVLDHGPSGEFGLQGLDEISIVQAGSNLGWPIITGCDANAGMVTPIISWEQATPVAGGAICRNCAIPQFNGNLIVGALGRGTDGRQLQRIVFDPASKTLVRNEVYLEGAYGRLREVVQGPDGALYITTSNCDGRGACPSDGDYVLRVTGG